jgi:hypothetical protein
MHEHLEARGAEGRPSVAAVPEAKERPEPADVAAWQLFLVKLLVVLMPVAIVVALVRPVFWPFVAWHMYSGDTFAVPGSDITDTAIRVTGASGRTRVLRIDDLMPDGRGKGVAPLLQTAFGPSADPGHCAVLLTLAEHHLRDEVVRMDRVERSWTGVDVWSAGMLDPNRPDGEVITGRAGCLDRSLP